MAKPKRILLITQWFDPEPTFKGLAFARALLKQGFEVEVLTGFPNYPGGKVYAGYKIKWLQREQIEGVHITRVPLYPNHSQSPIKRVLNYVSFAVSVVIYGLFMAKRADVIYAYHPPLTVGVAASLIRWLRRTPLVYDIQDMWPDTLRATGMLGNERALAVVARACDWVYRRVDQIVVLSPGFKRLLMERGVPETKIDVIYNWADELALMSPTGCLPKDWPGADRFRIIFAGNMGKAQALDTVLEAASILKNRGSRVSFVLLGGGVEVTRLNAKAKDLSLENVVFLPPVPMAEVGVILAAADALLVHLRKDPLFQITIPSKTQAFMAMGKPVLMAVGGDAAELISQSNGGILCDPENAQALAESAQKLAMTDARTLVSMGESGQAYYYEHLALDVGVQRFGDLFRRLSVAEGS